jgi:hypothetical protein
MTISVQGERAERVYMERVIGGYRGLPAVFGGWGNGHGVCWASGRCRILHHMRHDTIETVSVCSPTHRLQWRYDVWRLAGGPWFRHASRPQEPPLTIESRDASSHKGQRGARLGARRDADRTRCGKGLWQYDRGQSPRSHSPLPRSVSLRALVHKLN